MSLPTTTVAASPANPENPVAAPHPPRLGRVFRGQLLRVAGTRRRGLGIALGLVLLQIVVMAGWGIVFGLRVSGTVDGTEPAVGVPRVTDLGLGFPIDPGLAAVWFAGIAALVWAVFWPTRVWRHETPRQRDYHWSLPVERRLHDGLRLLAGGTWLALLCAILVTAAVVAAAVSGHTGLLSQLTPWFWLDLLVAPMLVYGLLSILYLRTENPAGWQWGGGWGVAIVLSILATVFPTSIGAPVRAVTVGPYGLVTTLVGPLWKEVGSVQATGPGLAAGWLLWGSLIAAGLWIAASTRSKQL